MKSIAAVPKTLLQHDEHCRGTKYNAAAQKTSLQHEMQCHGTKNMVVAPTTNTSPARLIVF